MIRLQDWALDLAPEIGGGVRNCRYKGVDVLAPERKTADANDARSLSAFPMVPFIGRISDGRFNFAARNIQLPPNMPPEPHAIHGQGWQSIWYPERAENGSLKLHYSNDGQSAWPWAYRAAQIFKATGNTLTWSMTLTNQSDSVMPAGLGWHPYFPRQGAVICANVTHVWETYETGPIATTPRPLAPDTDISKARPVDGFLLDHCYSAGPDGVMLTWPEKRMSVQVLSSSNLGHLTVYIPDGETYFCVEPVSHAPDAVNSTLSPGITGFKTIGPGEEMTVVIDMIAEIADA